MIIIGYPCIGKSTLAKDNDKIIDLESSNFNKRNELWYEDYCKIAEDLSRQGYIVFVSCHENVQHYLYKYSEEKVWLVFPEDTKEMYDYWSAKAKERYERTNLQKDLKAYDRINKNFAVDTRELKNSPIKQKVIIGYKDYNLEEMVEYMKNWNGKATEKDWLSAV